MDFKNLKSTTCPKCGAPACEEGVQFDTFGKEPKVRQHCNGERWEWRKFTCGQKIEWVPNYSREVLDTFYVCRQSPERLEMVKVREEWIESIITHVEETGDVDDRYRHTIVNHLRTDYHCRPKNVTFKPLPEEEPDCMDPAAWEPTSCADAYENIDEWD